MTSYRILRRTEHGAQGPYWEELATAAASSPHGAIRKLKEELPEIDGQWVAVPLRSWKPVTVKVETKTALKFS